MPYTDSDLGIFVAITDKKLLKGTAYFELHQGPLPSEFACWLDGSLFISDEAFNFFELCFQKGLPGFDYLSFNVARPSEVSQIEAEIRGFLTRVRRASDRETLFSRTHAEYPKDNWDLVSADALRASLLCCGEAIQDYVAEANTKGLVLHILGM